MKLNGSLAPGLPWAVSGRASGVSFPSAWPAWRAVGGLGLGEHLLEAALQQRAVGPAEGADAVVILVPVRAEQAHGDVLLGGAFDLATAEGARRVGINPETEVPAECLRMRMRKPLAFRNFQKALPAPSAPSREPPESLRSLAVKRDKGSAA